MLMVITAPTLIIAKEAEYQKAHPSHELLSVGPHVLTDQPDTVQLCFIYACAEGIILKPHPAYQSHIREERELALAYLEELCDDRNFPSQSPIEYMAARRGSDADPTRH